MTTTPDPAITTVPEEAKSTPTPATPDPFLSGPADWPKGSRIGELQKHKRVIYRWDGNSWVPIIDL